MYKAKRILICPLNWGLGHATRCVPIIRLLLSKGAEVIIAADGRPLALLKQEFPQLQTIEFKGYNINYPSSGSMTLKMLLAIPKILKGIKKEHFELDNIVTQHQIDIVISDNRYGCWTKKAKSIFITHQLMIKSPFAERALHHRVMRYITNFEECWVPDWEGEKSLTGDLTQKYKLPSNTTFIGPLSRFSNSVDSEAVNNFRYDVAAIISGPEPQRSIFERQILEQLNTNNLKSILIQGTPEISEERTSGLTKIVSHLSTNEMEKVILQSKIILSRSGYSTIMDLAQLNKKALFVPTPGQTEQEYLAEFLMKKNIACFQKQCDFNLKEGLLKANNSKGFDKRSVNSELEGKINELLQN